jgi:DNA helicase-2/ATP-dependent DNA helicase PcrA
MAGRKPFTYPEILDADIDWVCSVLKLRADAFCGPAGDDVRLAVLKSQAGIDVAACPGSGKTTLLVAKLAILARRWPHRDQGICVLSHTNVARREIEAKLGGTTESRRLLSYPHHVGTIHGFINTYIAVPWLRSLGHPVTRIDDDIVQRRRWFKLTPGNRAALERSNKTAAVLRIHDREFGLGNIPWAAGGTLGHDTPLYGAMRDACRASAQEGDFCYEEMFVFAHDALDRLPYLAQSVRQRFPLLFIDEVQDNSEAQSRLLHRIFVEGGRPAVRQRFGDMNQAIYGRSDDAVGAATDPFPEPAATVEIPNSHRFGQVIASAANPFGLAPAGLVGVGPSGPPLPGGELQPLMLLFDQASARAVLPSYARHLGEVFGEAELRDGVFTAVGAVHRDGDADRFPRSVGHYWDDYDHRLSSLEPKPDRFIQYVLLGLARMGPTGDVRPLADKVAEGLLELAYRSDPHWQPPHRRNAHRQVLERLSNDIRVRGHYLRLVTAIAEGRLPATGPGWEAWVPSIRAIGRVIAGADAAADENGFLAWQAAPIGDEAQLAPTHRDNIYQCADDPRVRIKVGSIHSVKGETHTATLVLETFYFEHHLQRLKPWLLGATQGRGRQAHNSRIGVGLKQHYVAMTRPTHLLALAMRAEDFTAAEIETLQARAWRVARVGDGALNWI